jgi:addiction module RelE/StbE family toxin
MPAEYQLRYLPIAQDDLLGIYDYIAQDSPTRAESFVDRLDKAIVNLETQPLLGRTPRHDQLREYGYRVLIVESYLVFYIIRNKTIEIHRVVHGSRNLDHLF